MTTPTVATPRRSREDELRERFEREANSHRMTVALDQGVYRHLRFAQADHWAYHYSLVTWPGHLAITGDCGSYTFARTTDMFSFFRPDKYHEHEPRWWINPTYWAEKLCNSDARDGTRVYDHELYEQRVAEWLDEAPDAYDLDDEDMVDLRAAADDQLLSEWDTPMTRDQAVTKLGEFACTVGGRRIRIDEPYEWSLRDWDWQYLWCCWAIVQGIAQYDWAKGWSA